MSLREPYRVQSKKVAAGNTMRRKGWRQMSIQFDDTMFNAVRARAIVENTSFAEQVRLLVEWGLEADEKA